jgi:hypothetical protein
MGAHSAVYISCQLALLQFLSVPKILTCVVGTVGAISRDLALLTCGWHTVGTSHFLLMRIELYYILLKLYSEVEGDRVIY